NDVALGARREGAARIRMAEASFNQGKPHEAMNLLKLADTQYLSPADRQYMVRLQEKMRTTPVNQGPNLPPPNVAKGDYKAFMTAARSALQRGELESAEAFCAQAEKVRPAIVPFWQDTPAKVRRDIQTTRARLIASPIPDKKDKGAKGMFSRPKDDVRQVGNDGPMLPPAPKGQDKGTMESSGPFQGIKNAMAWPGSLLPGGKSDNPPLTQDQRTEKARQLVAQARQAMRNNDMERARRLVMQARDLQPSMDFTDPDNPTRMFAEMQRGSSNSSANMINPPGMAPPKPEVVATSKDPRELVRQARAALAQNKLEEADYLCKKAASIPTKWGLFE